MASAHTHISVKISSLIALMVLQGYSCGNVFSCDVSTRFFFLACCRMRCARWKSALAPMMQRMMSSMNTSRPKKERKNVQRHDAKSITWCCPNSTMQLCKFVLPFLPHSILDPTHTHQLFRIALHCNPGDRHTE